MFRYEDASTREDKGKKSTSPVYTYTGSTGTGASPRQQAKVVTTGTGSQVAVSPYGAMPLSAGANMGATYTDAEGRVNTWNPRTNSYEVTGFRPQDVKAPYYSREGYSNVFNPRTGVYEVVSNAPSQRAGQAAAAAAAGALTPEQLASIGQQMIAAETAAAQARAALPQALQTAEMNYFGDLRGARQGATAASQDWRAILAGAGLGRSPAIGMMQLERVRGGLTGREIELAAAREAAKAEARQAAREAQAAAAATRANLAQQVAMYETGNIDEYLKQLFGGYLPSSGS